MELTEILGLVVASVVVLIGLTAKWVKATPSKKDDEFFARYVSPIGKVLEALGKKAPESGSSRDSKTP